MRDHLAVLRFARAPRGVRPASTQRAVGDPLIGFWLPGAGKILQDPVVPAVPADSLRRVVAQVFKRPEYEWIERSRLSSWLARQWQHLSEWLNNLATNHPVGYNIALTIVVIVLIVLLVHVGYVIWRIVQPAARTGTAKATSGSGIVMDAAAHLSRADDLARAGRYAEALGHVFLAVVLELDRMKAVRFHSSKTPAEYVGEARLTDAGRASLASLVAQLYRHLFGAIPCDQTEYREFGQAAQELVRGRNVLPA